MLITYYEDGSTAPTRPSRGLALLMAINILFALSILFAWTYMALFVAEPLTWAMWMEITRGYGPMGVLRYPFVMLWLMPTVGVLGSWISLKGGRRILAFALVSIPIMMLLLIMGWFHLLPHEWH